MSFFIKLKWSILTLFFWSSDWLLFFVLKGLHFSLLWIIPFVLIKLYFIETTWWKIIILIAGFPLSLLLIDSNINNLLWISTLILLLLIYPPNLWREAPIYPTRTNTLQGVQKHLKIKADSQILDIGSGLGNGIIELKREFPTAKVFGVENSFLLWLLSKFITPKNKVYLSNMWNINWGNFNVLYIFQRPEIMTSVWLKAKDELKSGSFLISLEFEIPNIKPYQIISNNNKNIFIYQV